MYRRWDFGNPLTEMLVRAIGMSVAEYAEAHGWKKATAVHEQLKRGYCAWPRRDARNGNSRHPLYRRWGSMWSRCTNPNEESYANYGGRGIRVCAAWVRFEQFAADVGMPPTPDHTLDRIDSDGDYAPGNVRWALWEIQTHNRRYTAGASGYRGVAECRTGVWRAYGTEKGKRVHLGYFRNPHRAAAAFNRHAIRVYGQAARLNLVRRKGEVDECA